VEMEPDAEGARRDARDHLRQRIDLAHDSAADYGKHAAKGPSVRTPCERVNGAKGANPVGHPCCAGNAGWSAEVMKNQRNLRQIERLDDCRKDVRRRLQAHFTHRQAVALSAARRIEAYTAEFVFEIEYDVAPYERPQAGVDEKQHRAAADIGHRDLRAI